VLVIVLFEFTRHFFNFLQLFLHWINVIFELQKLLEFVMQDVLYVSVDGVFTECIKLDPNLFDLFDTAPQFLLELFIELRGILGHHQKKECILCKSQCVLAVELWLYYVLDQEGDQ
jgi:hypothetical protein